MGKLGNGKLINEHEYGEVRYYKDFVPQENNIRYLWKIYKHLLVPSLFAKF